MKLMLGNISPNAAEEIIDIAGKNRMAWIDVGAYEDNDYLGTILFKQKTPFNIIAKLCLDFASVPPERVQFTIKHLLHTFKAKVLYGLLVSSKDLVAGHANMTMAVLRTAKSRGYVKKIGMFSRNVVQAEEAVLRHKLDLIQVPINIIDQRFAANGFIEETRNRGVEVHAHSVFLNGILESDPDEWNSYFDDLKPTFDLLHKIALAHNISVRKLSMEYLKSLRVDRLMIDVESASYLEEVLFEHRLPFKHGIDFTQFANNDKRFIDSIGWPSGGWK